VRREKIGRILKEAREQYFKRLKSQGGAVKTIAKREDNLLFVIDKEEVCEYIFYFVIQVIRILLLVRRLAQAGV
jgi:hypothetical protein